MCRSDKKNALNSKFVSELKSIFQFAENDEKCKVIVLQSDGDDFCAGADLQYLQSLQKFTEEENEADSNHLMELFYQIYTLKKVVIASIKGAAIAGGCGLATVCDFSISTKSAKFSYSEVKIGFIPAIVSVFLIKKIGEGKSKELLLSGKIINAQEAVDIGLINHWVENENLQESILELAQSIINNCSSQSLGSIKKLIAEIQNLELEEGLKWAVKANTKARKNEDCKRGIQAFLDKKKLNW